MSHRLIPQLLPSSPPDDHSIGEPREGEHRRKSVEGLVLALVLEEEDGQAVGDFADAFEEDEGRDKA